MTDLEALFDAVIVKPQEEEETTYGSIVVPDLGKDRNEHGTVVAVGPGRHVAGVGFIETEIKIGDKVILPTIGFTKLEHKGDEFYIDAPPFMHYHGYYINHSSTPNCFWDRRTGDIYTQVDISEGQELTMHYKPNERDF